MRPVANKHKPAHVDPKPTIAPGKVRMVDGNVCSLPSGDKCNAVVACPDCITCREEYRRKR